MKSLVRADIEKTVTERYLYSDSHQSTTKVSFYPCCSPNMKLIPFSLDYTSAY